LDAFPAFVINTMSVVIDADARREQIVFYDLETTTEAEKEIIEFGAVVVDKKGWFEISSFSTLLNADAKVSPFSVKINGITSAMLKGAPSFAEAADRIHDVLHGRMWAGHNIISFDNVHINKAFEKLGRQAPVSAGHLDTLNLLKPTFGKRAGSLKLADLSTYFGLGAEKHRALDDARLCLDVVKLAATTLFFEQHVPNHFAVPVVAAAEAKAKVEKVQKEEAVEAKQPAPAAEKKEKKEKKPRNKKTKENKDSAPAAAAPVATQPQVVATPAVAVVAEAKRPETVAAPVAASSATVPNAWTGKSYSTVLAAAAASAAAASVSPSPASSPSVTSTATAAEAKESKSPKEKKEKREKKDNGKDKEKRVRKSKKERAQNSQNSQSSEEEEGWISILPKRDLKGHNNAKKSFNKDDKKEARANFKRVESLAIELEKAMSEGKSLFIAYDGGRTAATEDKPVGVREVLPVKWEARPYKFQAVPLPRRESKDKKKEGEEKEEVLLSFATKKIVQLRSEPFSMTPGQPTVAAPKPAYVPPVWPGKPVAASSQ